MRGAVPALLGLPGTGVFWVTSPAIVALCGLSWGGISSVVLVCLLQCQYWLGLSLSRRDAFPFSVGNSGLRSVLTQSFSDAGSLDLRLLWLCCAKVWQLGA